MMMGIPDTRVTGYTYEADYHCTECAKESFGLDEHGYLPENATDHEGGPVGAIFADSDVDAVLYCGDHDGLFCARCGDISGPFPFDWPVTSADGDTNTYHCPNCGATSEDRND